MARDVLMERRVGQAGTLQLMTNQDVFFIFRKSARPNGSVPGGTFVLLALWRRATRSTAP